MRCKTVCLPVLLPPSLVSSPALSMSSTVLQNVLTHPRAASHSSARLLPIRSLFRASASRMNALVLSRSSEGPSGLPGAGAVGGSKSYSLHVSLIVTPKAGGFLMKDFSIQSLNRSGCSGFGRSR